MKFKLKDRVRLTQETIKLFNELKSRGILTTNEFTDYENEDFEITSIIGDCITLGLNFQCTFKEQDLEMVYEYAEPEKKELFQKELIELCLKYHVNFYAGYIDAGDDDNNLIIEDMDSNDVHNRRYYISDVDIRDYGYTH